MAQNRLGRDAIDAIDRQIVHALVRNARTPNNALAKHLGLAASSCLGRVRALEERQIISGYHADVSLPNIGLPIQAMVAVRLHSHTREEMDGFLFEASKLPGIVSIFCMAGADDYLLHVAARSPNELRDFVLDKITCNPAVDRTETSLVFTHIRNLDNPLALGDGT